MAAGMQPLIHKYDLPGLPTLLGFKVQLLARTHFVKLLNSSIDHPHRTTLHVLSLEQRENCNFSSFRSFACSAPKVLGSIAAATGAA